MTKTKKKKSNIFKKIKGLIVPVVLTIILTVLIILTYQVIVQDTYYLFTFAGDTNVSLLSQGEAIRKLQDNFDQRSAQKLQFVYSQQDFTIDLATASANIDYSALEQSFNTSHSGTFLDRLRKSLQTLFLTEQITPAVNLNLDEQTEIIQSAINIPPKDAQLVFDEITTPEGTPSSRIQILEGVDGLSLDKETLNKEVAQFILSGIYTAELPLKTVPPKITTQYALKAKQALENITQTPIKLTFENFSWTIDAKQLLTLLNLTTGADILLDQKKSDLFLGKIAKELDQDVQEGLFEFNPQTKRVVAFKPSKIGRKLDQDKTYQLIINALDNDASKTINLPVAIVKPKITTSDVNSLGIKELLGRGISHFAGSIPNRIYNVNLTASKINGVLIPPGEIFSFNATVGDITAATGFKQAYVIKEGRTVLDDGGGVCQDSTTLFRAVLNAGLPVVKRTAHAYRVGYYEQGFPPGLDATVFYPSVDFQFKNDTPAHILIQAYTAGTTLYVDLYGTSDGRISQISKSIITNQAPPPPELRQDDPTLPKGSVKQVDWAAWGATVTFTRNVVRGGETLIKETFKSNYKAWQAVYLVGTQ